MTNRELIVDFVAASFSALAFFFLIWLAFAADALTTGM